MAANDKGYTKTVVGRLASKLGYLIIAGILISTFLVPFNLFLATILTISIVAFSTLVYIMDYLIGWLEKRRARSSG